MKAKDLCIHCTEYSVGYDCDYADKCMLMKLNAENNKYKKTIKNLKERIKKLEEESTRNSWINNPDIMGR